MKKIIGSGLATSFSLVLVLSACGGDYLVEIDEDYFSICEGEVICDPGQGELYVSKMGPGSERICTLSGDMSGIALQYDGQVILDSSDEVIEDLYWTATAKGFDICGLEACHKCIVKNSGKVASNSTKGTCVGSATSCYSAVSCSGQKGCYMGYTPKYNGTMVEKCKGSATSCSSFDRKDSCAGQSGCSWRA